MTMDLAQSHEFVDGSLVSVKVQRVVQAIKDYEPTIEVDWIPPQARAEDAAAYRISHHPEGGKPYVMFYVKNDDEFDERVLARIIHNDQRNVNITYSDIEAAEAANKLVAKQKFLDEMEAAKDIARHLHATHKNTYTWRDPKTGQLMTHKE